MSTHYIEEAQRLADTVLIMSHGKAVAAGPPAELVAEHAGSEAVEVYGPPARLAEVEAEAAAAGLRTRRTGTSVSVLGVDGATARARGRAPPGEPRGRLRPPHRRGDRLMADRGRAPRRSAGSSAPAITGVLVREVINFSSYWRSATFSSTVEPTIYLLAFGFGFGSLVSTVGGYDYVEFVGTGTVATAVLFSSAFPAMFGTFVKYQFQRTYDAILAAPVDTEELVTAEALWIATRAGVYGCVPMLVAMFFGLDPSWGMLLVPVHRLFAGFGWACFGIAIAGFAKSIENFSYIISAVLTPLFLVAGTFFPISTLPRVGAGPRAAQPALPVRRARPRSGRSASAGTTSLRVGLLVVFGLLMWRIAIRAMTQADRLSEPELPHRGRGARTTSRSWNGLLGDPAMIEYLGGPESLEKIAERHERYVTPARDGHGRDVHDRRRGDRRERRLGRLLGRETRRTALAYETGWAVLPAVPGPRHRDDRNSAGDRAPPSSRRAPVPVRVSLPWRTEPSNAICRKLGFEVVGVTEYEYPNRLGQHPALQRLAPRALQRLSGR